MKFKIILFSSGIFFMILTKAVCQSESSRINPDYKLIAHRGGVVDSLNAENSLSALREAVKRGYYMAEIDLRLTRDSVFVTNHDSNLLRYFGVDASISSMTWNVLKNLEGKKGNKILKLEEVLKYSSGKIQIMLDNKISGNDTILFARVIDMLKKYNLYENALMIGTDESTEFFTGKIKLSCTRKQLEENMLKPGFKAENYYLFSNNISQQDAEWARQKKILTVGVINSWDLKSADPQKLAAERAEQIKSAGINYIQIDSDFEKYFR